MDIPAVTVYMMFTYIPNEFIYIKVAGEVLCFLRHAQNRWNCLMGWKNQLKNSLHLFAQPGKKPRGPQMSDVGELRGEKATFTSLEQHMLVEMGSPSGRFSKMPGRKLIIDMNNMQRLLIPVGWLIFLYIYVFLVYFNFFLEQRSKTVSWTPISTHRPRDASSDVGAKAQV